MDVNKLMAVLLLVLLVAELAPEIGLRQKKMDESHAHQEV